METIKHLLDNNDIYPKRFKENYGIKGPHWANETWFARELSLRHDMVCVLLTNMEVLKRNQDEEAPGTSKKPRLTFIVEEGGSENMLWDDFELNPEEDEIEMFETIEDDFDFPKIPGAIYRFICLEGKTNISLIQNKYAREWGCMFPSKQWDIIDLQEKKFIEVKVCISFEEEINNYMVYSEEIKGNASLFLVNPRTIKLQWIDHPGGIRGEQKALDFLAKRKMVFDKAGVMESTGIEKVDLVEYMFTDLRLNKSVSDWWKPIWELRNKEFPVNVLNEKALSIDSVNPLKLLSLLEDPREGDDESVYWKGKLLPTSITHSLTTEEASDAEMVDLIMKMLSPEMSTLVSEILEIWNSNKNTFRFLSRKQLMGKEDLKTMLGVCAKGHCRDDSDSTTLQPEYTAPKKLSYHPWFDNVMKDLSCQCPNEGTFSPEIQKEKMEPISPMAKMINRLVNPLISSFCNIFMASTCSKYINTYSRIGGTYLGDQTANPNHSSVSVFPLYATCHEEDKIVRYVDGLCIRGPHHARSSTDKINLLIIELISNKVRPQKYLPFLKYTERHVTEDFIVNIKQNAVSKHDPNYFTFLINTMFIPVNLCGEIVEELIIRGGLQGNSHQDLVDQMSNDYSQWFVNRFVKNVLMEILGTPQEEGAMAHFRKIFMILLNWSRGSGCMTWDLATFCEKTNECLINSPLAMYYQCSIIDLLKSWGEQKSEFSL